MDFVISILLLLMSAFSILIFIDIIMSWFQILYKFSFFRLIHKIVDAYMGIFRGFLTIGMFDFTPIIGIILFDGLTYAFQWLLG